MNKLFVIAGQSGSGKDTIMKELLQEVLKQNINIKLLSSCTTRPMRDGEKQGAEYNFTDNKTFYDEYKNENVLEYATYNTHLGAWHYYTLKSDLGLAQSSYLKICNPLGICQLRSAIPEEQIIVILIDCDDETRMVRIIHRGDDSIEAARRVNQDNKDFKYLAHDYSILNDEFATIGECVNQIMSIIKEELS